jgi:hypothetical protein
MLVVEESRVEDERIVTERRLRAVPVLILSCIVFAAAAAAFAWTTLRVHDRQVSAESHEKALAFVLGTPDVRMSEQPATSGGSVTAFYSPKLRKIAITGHDLPALSGGRTYAFWYRTGPGLTPRPAGTSRFNSPQSDMIIVATAAPATDVVVTIEPSGGGQAPTTPVIAELTLG